MFAQSPHSCPLNSDRMSCMGNETRRHLRWFEEFVFLVILLHDVSNTRTRRRGATASATRHRAGSNAWRRGAVECCGTVPLAASGARSCCGTNRGDQSAHFPRTIRHARWRAVCELRQRPRELLQAKRQRETADEKSETLAVDVHCSRH